MIEYLVVGLLSVGVAWLAYKHTLLEQQVIELQSAQPQTASAARTPANFKESVAQMIGEVRTAADKITQEVAQKIEDLRTVQTELENKSSEMHVAANEAVDQIKILADSARQEVAQKIEDLRTSQTEFESRLSEVRFTAAQAPSGLEESVAQMIDELKTTADTVCQEVAQKIEDLRTVQTDLQTQMVDDLKTAADGVCQEVTQRIEDLRTTHTDFGAQIVDEIRTAADSACQEVTQKIEELRTAQNEFESRPSEMQFAARPRTVMPLATLTQLADSGLSTSEIARQTGIGQAEVELTLRLHRGKPRLPTTLERIKETKRHLGKETAIA